MIQIVNRGTAMSSQMCVLLKWKKEPAIQDASDVYLKILIYAIKEVANAATNAWVDYATRRNANQAQIELVILQMTASITFKMVPNHS